MSNAARVLKPDDWDVLGPGTRVVFKHGVRCSKRTVRPGVTGTVEQVLPILRVRSDKIFSPANEDGVVELLGEVADVCLVPVRRRATGVRYVAFDVNKL